MDPHLSEMEIKELLDNKVSGDRLLEIDAHLSECAECSARTEAEASGRLGEVSDLAAEEPELHLDYETLEAYMRKDLGAVESEIADVHLHECAACRSELDDLLALKAELETKPNAGPLEGGAAVRGREAGLGTFWRFLVPALGFAAAALLFGVWYLRLNDRIASIDPSPVPTPSSAPSPAPTPDSVSPTPEPSVSPEPEMRVSLKDGAGAVGITEDGEIIGISGGAFEADVRRALSGGKIDVDRSGSALKQGSGSLMGPGSGVPFALGSPVGSVVESSRPVFRWSKLDEAQSYRVEVYDDSFSQVAKSPDLTSTSWRPASPLPRGKTFRWQVTAVKEDEEIRSPTRPAPDARFRVISAADANAIEAARRTNGRSNLVMGIAYAKAGLLAEAEKEFAALLRKNPGSPVAQRLLQQVRSRR